jgi:hypothetical protein
LDALRILRGETQASHQTVPLVQENSYSKVVEVSTESLPAGFFQVLFVLQARDPTALQLASILVSIITTAVTVATVDFGSSSDPRTRVTDDGMLVRYHEYIPDGNVAEFCLFTVMVCCSSTQMAVATLGTALLADYDSRLALGAWAGRLAAMYAVKVARQDFAYYLPIRGMAGFLLAALMPRPGSMFVSDFAFFLYGRHPFEMGCAQWWSGRVWVWLLLVAAIALRAQRSVAYDQEPPLANATLAANLSMDSDPLPRNAPALAEPLPATEPWFAHPEFLAAFAAALFVLWLVSHLAFFRLCKRESWSSFRATHTAAAYVKLRWEVAQSDERRAALLAKLHPSALRATAPYARTFVAAYWSDSPDDRPAWMTDRWLRAVPSSMLPNEVLKALGGKLRRRSTLLETLELLNDKAGAAPLSGTVNVNPVSLSQSAGSDVVPVEDAAGSDCLLAVVPTAGP